MVFLQGAKPSFSPAPVPLLNYSTSGSGGLMAIAGRTSHFALQFSGAMCRWLSRTLIECAHEIDRRAAGDLDPVCDTSSDPKGSA